MQEFLVKMIDFSIFLYILWMHLPPWSTDEWVNKVFNTNFRRSTGEARKLTYAASFIGSGLVFISCLFEPACLGAMNLSDIIPLKSEAWIPPPSNHQATVGSIFVCQRMGLIYRFCQSSSFLPASDWETGSNNMTWTTSDMSAAEKRGIAKGLLLRTTEGKIDCNIRDKNLSFWGYITVLSVIPKYIYIYKKKYNLSFKHEM